MADWPRNELSPLLKGSQTLSSFGAEVTLTRWPRCPLQAKAKACRSGARPAQAQPCTQSSAWSPAAARLDVSVRRPGLLHGNANDSMTGRDEEVTASPSGCLEGRAQPAL